MAHPDFPGFAAASASAISAESVAAHLHKADAFFMAGDASRYNRHIDYALERIDALTKMAAEVRAEREAQHG